MQVYCKLSDHVSALNSCCMLHVPGASVKKCNVYCTQKTSCTANACSALMSVSDSFCNVRTQVVDACPRCNNDTALYRLFPSKDAIHKSSYQRAELFPFYIKTRGEALNVVMLSLCASPPKGSVVARVCRFLAKTSFKIIWAVHPLPVDELYIRQVRSP